MNRMCLLADRRVRKSERACAEWQSASVTPQFIVSFSLISKHFIEFSAIDIRVGPIVVSAIAVFRRFDNILSSIFHYLTDCLYLQTRFIGKPKP